MIRGLCVGFGATVGLCMFMRGQVVFQGFSWDLGVILLFLPGDDRENVGCLRELSQTTLGAGSVEMGGGTAGGCCFLRRRRAERVMVMASRMMVRIASTMIRWLAWSRLVLRASTCSG